MSRIKYSALPLTDEDLMALASNIGGLSESSSEAEESDDGFHIEVEDSDDEDDENDDDDDEECVVSEKEYFSDRYGLLTTELDDTSVIVNVVINQEEPPPKYDASDGRPDQSLPLTLGMSDLSKELLRDEEMRRARCIVYCLKSYCIIFVIFCISLAGYLAAGSFGGAAGGLKRDEIGELKVITGYKTLRLGNRRVFFKSLESIGMANHTVLLIHGDDSTSELFTKLGTLRFLSAHGARAVAIDVIGFGKSDPPIHLEEDYENFFEEIITLFELEYNLIFVCIEQGCERLLPYYLKHGVYRPENSFIEGAVFISPKGESYSRVVQPEKMNIVTGTRTLVVNGAKDEYVNLEVVKSISSIPRTEIHSLPDQKNRFYKNSKSKAYFHAALQAFIDGLDYTYDRDMEMIISNQSFDQQQQGGFQQQNQQGFNQVPYPNQIQYNQQQNGYQNGFQQQNFQQRPLQNYIAGQGGFNQGLQQSGNQNLFDKFKQQQQGNSDKFGGGGYNPAGRFSGVKGKK